MHGRHKNGRVFVEKHGKKRIDISDRVKAVGIEKPKGLIGFHNFAGADWGGKFVRITKETWTKAYLDLSKDKDVSCFELLRSLSLSVNDFDGRLPSGIAQL